MNLRVFQKISAIYVFLLLLLSVSVPHPAGALTRNQLDGIHLPPGFKIDLYARDVPNARSMVMSPQGILFVGTCRAGKVYAVLDRNQDNMADEVITIDAGLNMPTCA